MKQSCLFQRFVLADINEMKIDYVMPNFKGPEVWDFDAFLSLNRKKFWESLNNMNCLKCDSEQYAIFKFCLMSPFKEFGGWPLKFNIVNMKTKNILWYIVYNCLISLLLCVLFNINKKYNCLILLSTPVTNRIIQSRI